MIKTQLETGTKFIANTIFHNNPGGWCDLAYEILGGTIKVKTMRTICHWNDPNGMWVDKDHTGRFEVNRRELELQLLKWTLEAQEDDLT